MYTVEMLVDPANPTWECEPEDIADTGRVVGNSDGGGNPLWVAMAWNVSAFAQAAPAGSDSLYLAVNNLNQAVGVRGAGDFPTTTPIFSDGLTTVDLPLPSGGAPVGINDSGKIIGGDLTDARGYLFDRISGTLTRIPPPPGETNTEPWAINAAGEIVGRSGSGTFVHAQGASRPIGLDQALDINSSGVACGSIAASTSPLFLPAICDTRAAQSPVTALPVPTGRQAAQLLGINSSGVAVGIAHTFANGQFGAQTAFIHSGGMSLDLNDLTGDPAWRLDSALAINDAGQIIGYGVNNNRFTGYVATPVRKRRPFWVDVSVIFDVLLFGGVLVDGGGWVVVGGKPRPVGPRGPSRELGQEKRDALLLLALEEAARDIADKRTRDRVRAELAKAAARHAKAVSGEKVSRRRVAEPAPAERRAGPLSRRHALLSQLAELRKG